MAKVRSAVAIVETPEHRVVQRRPNLPGKLAYPGKIQLLGGHANDGEDLSHAVIRELGEETTLVAGELTAVPIWEGPYLGKDRDGQPVERYVGLFRVVVSDSFELREAGELVYIPKGAAIEPYETEMTPFAYWALTTAMKRGEE
ncbi:MAG TPA: NUDIX hydrolase [Candidatus Saccharimonadales bacterium]|nr:NUDIX hydrolase [Candidatus Saccharimonadales bacterium]